MTFRSEGLHPLEDGHSFEGICRSGYIKLKVRCQCIMILHEGGTPPIKTLKLVISFAHTSKHQSSWLKSYQCVQVLAVPWHCAPDVVQTHSLHLSVQVCHRGYRLMIEERLKDDRSRGYRPLKEH